MIRKRHWLSFFLFGLVVGGGILLAIFFFRHPLAAISKIAGGKKLSETEGRTNFLILGLDKREQDAADGGLLTDTIIVASLGQTTKDVVMFSIPRDLWAPLGEYGSRKINEAYSDGGIELSRKTVEGVLGIPIHYYAVINFEVFRNVVDILGGVTVCVDRAFDDWKYPKPGFENVLPETERYEHLHFDVGCQQMNGETALKFSRSRNGNNGENNDSARSRRQQKVILAIKEKALSLDTLKSPNRLKALYDSFKEQVDTNLGLGEIQTLAGLSQEISGVRSFVFDNSDAGEANFLYHPDNLESYGGAWVFVPKAGDFSQVQAFVQKTLFGSQ